MNDISQVYGEHTSISTADTSSDKKKKNSTSDWKKIYIWFFS